MCGQDAPLKKAEIEGTKMRVCPDCREYGQEVDEPASQSSSTPTPQPGSNSLSSGVSSGSNSSGRSGGHDPYESTEKVLAEDYGTRVQKARQKKDLTAEELSNEINEKRSVIAKTETQDHHPSDKLVQKLERFLDIDLMVEHEPTQRVSSSKSSSSGSGNMTLGDLIKDEMDDDE